MAYCRLKALDLPIDVLKRYLIKRRYDGESVRKKLHTQIIPRLRLSLSLRLSLIRKFKLASSLPVDQRKNLSLQDAISSYEKKYFHIKDPYTLKEVFNNPKQTQRNQRQKKVYFEHHKLELCCGTGDFLIHYAKKEPTTAFIGVDYALPCVERAILSAANENILNVLFYHGSCEDFLQEDFRGALFDELMINFPDPWPKKRHYKRRVVNWRSINLFHQALADDGLLITATDVISLHRWHQNLLNESDLFLQNDANEFVLKNDAYRFASRYQKKNLAATKEISYTVHTKKNRTRLMKEGGA